MERDISTKETLRIVTKNDFITIKGLEKLSLKARKLLYLAVAQCRKNDSQLYEYQISVKEFARLIGVNATHVYQEARAFTKELMKIEVEHRNDKKQEFDDLHLFRRCKYDKKHGLYFKLEEDLEELYLNLQGNFMQPLLMDFMKMTKTYSMAIWHLCQREMKSKKPSRKETIEFDLSLSELKEVTGIDENKYRKISHFKDKIFDRALKEIEKNCLVTITYENIKQGRMIIGFRCKATCVCDFEENDLPPEVIEKGRRIRERFSQNV